MGARVPSCPTCSCAPLPSSARCSPKPNHYLQWLRTGQCNFKDMCKLVSPSRVAAAAAGRAAGGISSSNLSSGSSSSTLLHPFGPSPTLGPLPTPPPPPPPQGVENGFCVYAEEYSQYAPDWDVAQDLRRLCRNLSAGLWHIASPAPDKT